MVISNIFLKSGVSYQTLRTFSSSNVNYGMKNFNKFVLVKRGTEIEKKRQAENPDPDFIYTTYGYREPGYTLGSKRIVPPESIPELVVPDLTNCDLKPYVSYRAFDREEPEFTCKELFEAVYCRKIYEDFKANKLDEDGNPLQPSAEEKLTPQEAWANARKCNNDLMDEINPYTPRRVIENTD